MRSWRQNDLIGVKRSLELTINQDSVRDDVAPHFAGSAYYEINALYCPIDAALDIKITV